MMNFAIAFPRTSSSPCSLILYSMPIIGIPTEHELSRLRLPLSSTEVMPISLMP